MSDRQGLSEEVSSSQKHGDNGAEQQVPGVGIFPGERTAHSLGACFVGKSEKGKGTHWQKRMSVLRKQWKVGPQILGGPEPLQNEILGAGWRTDQGRGWEGREGQEGP